MHYRRYLNDRYEKTIGIIIEILRPEAESFGALCSENVHT